MSSAASRTPNLFRIATIFFAVLVAFAVCLAAVSDVDAAKKKKAKKGKAPVVTNVTPKDNVTVGDQLKLTGKYFVKGKKSMVVIFQREGSKRRFSTTANGTSTKSATVIVPDVSPDLVVSGVSSPTLNMFRLRVVSKYGASKAQTSKAVSPIINSSGVPLDNPGAAGDCDVDGVLNGIDTDDDNDMLDDATEAAIATNACKPDTDGDGPTDYYEYRVAYELNGGPTVPYPGRMPFPNPISGDSGEDFDRDNLTMLEEYKAWQFTKRMDRFYSDADQDSDGDGKTDDAEDEDGDLMPNIVELRVFVGDAIRGGLDWLVRDTDGDSLCDGLDDQDHDGPPTPPSVADCTTQVPNNGAGGTPPSAGAGDPNPALIDGDDNRHSNFYEWYLGGALEDSSGEAYNSCLPDPYPISPYCETSPFNPLPVPDP